MIGPFQVSANNLSVTDNGDFIQLRMGSTTKAQILEIRVWQESDLTITAMHTLRIQRGAGGAVGSALTEREYDIAGAGPVATAFSLPTTDVGTLDFDLHAGWNILQEFVWLPTPELQLPLAASDHLGVSLRVNDTLTIGASITWVEFGV